ncbi:undecaprenyl diphosphate synthase family protein [Geoglobus sp.]
MLNLIYRVYRQKLEHEVIGKRVPAHIMVVISPQEFLENTDRVVEFVEWCRQAGVREVTYAVDGDLSTDDISRIVRRIPGRVRVISRDSTDEFGEGNVRVNINLGVRGREEILEAVRSLARDVIEGKLEPDSVNEDEIGKRLKIRSEPDVIIRAGLRARDFLIWQGIYSEHVFFDSDWKNLRYIDFLRILREYQKRERRYGR